MNKKITAYSLRFRLALSTEKYLEVYKGNARNVLVHCEDNRRIQFPTSAIQKFLTHDGIYGLFEIQFDENNKLIQIIKVNT